MNRIFICLLAVLLFFGCKKSTSLVSVNDNNSTGEKTSDTTSVFGKWEFQYATGGIAGNNYISLYAKGNEDELVFYPDSTYQNNYRAQFGTPGNFHIGQFNFNAPPALSSLSIRFLTGTPLAFNGDPESLKMRNDSMWIGQNFEDQSIWLYTKVK